MTVPRNFGLIIGAMKSGTTSLFELLAQHHEIAPCRKKEPALFEAPEISPEAWERYVELWDWDPSRHRIALEASTGYSKAPWIPGVPDRIAARSRERFRFIYMMRDPIDRISSQVRHSLYEGWGRPVDEGLTRDVIDFTRYAAQIDEYLRVFPRESMLLLTLEELKTEPKAVLRRTCAFLGVSEEHAFERAEEPRNVGSFYEIPPVLKRVAQSSTAQAVLRRMPQRMRRSLRERLARVGSGRGRHLGRWRLTENEAADVLRELAPDLTRLRDVHGVDIHKHWKIPASLGAPDR